MKLQIEVNKAYCIMAVAHALYCGGIVNSAAGFKNAIRNYLYAYGRSSMEDDVTTFNGCIDTAKTITERYYHI